jgi:hypothetical protein
MTEPIPERRRRPRFEPPPVASALLPSILDIHVLDISRSGILFSTARELRVGQRAKVQLLFGPDLFWSGIEVRRIQPLPTPVPTFAVGARFVELDAATLETLDRVLRRVSH